MPLRAAFICATLIVLSTSPISAADWTGFRGPGGQGVSTETDVPSKWSSTENIAWKAELPGPGASSPITLGDRVFVTCYSGYGLKPNEGDQKNLVRHLLCLDRASGKILWQKQFQPKLPEHNYQGEGSYHGYAGSTPTTDGERLYVFFGKSGVFCFDLSGNELWNLSVGERTSGWGSGASPILFGKLLIVNASVESSSLVALDKESGKEVWRAKNIGSAWNTPLLVGGEGEAELVVSVQDRVLGIDPNKGDELWRAEGVHRYVCPSVVTNKGVVLAIGGGSTSLAVRTGGRGDVTGSHVLWRKSKGSNVGSPIYHEGHLYWASDNGGTICCQNAATGEDVFQTRLEPRPGLIWSSPVLAAGKLYFVSQHAGTYVVAAKPKFELVAHNIFQDDDSRANASPAVSNGQLFLRTDRNLYCIGKK
jgi:outer membrane protein assembly factor BamB